MRGVMNTLYAREIAVQRFMSLAIHTVISKFIYEHIHVLKVAHQIALHINKISTSNATFHAIVGPQSERNKRNRTEKISVKCCNDWKRYTELHLIMHFTHISKPIYPWQNEFAPNLKISNQRNYIFHFSIYRVHNLLVFLIDFGKRKWVHSMCVCGEIAARKSGHGICAMPR